MKTVSSSSRNLQRVYLPEFLIGKISYTNTANFGGFMRDLQWIAGALKPDEIPLLKGTVYFAF